MTVCVSASAATDFNPRTPCGVRRAGQQPQDTGGNDFNPRTPCGVRQVDNLVKGLGGGISIHAPLAGCDVVAFLLSSHRSISIHAPLAGCDAFQIVSVQNFAISIHAPLAGCDVTGCRNHVRCNDFNPRTPCGVRLVSFRTTAIVCYFNPRTPCGVRRRAAIFDSQLVVDFNPRTPCGVRPH